MQMISIGDAELSVDVTGNGGPVMLVSGLGGRASFWAHQVGPLSQQFQVITHDHRGTGASTKSEISYSVAQMAEDVLRLMDALDVSQTAMVGHSTGGAITQYLALNHPDRLTRIVLSATWAGPSTYFRELFDMRSGILKALGPEAYLTDGILRAFPPHVLSRQPELLENGKEDRVVAFPGETIELSRIAAVMNHDLRDQVSKISHPTLVIGAADDQITPSPFFDELAVAIPGAQQVTLAGGGHFVPQVRIADYNDAVLNFLTAQD